MQLSLDERKQQLVLQCLEEYTTAPRKWWQRRAVNEYKSTWDIYQEKSYPREYRDTVEIRNDLISGILYSILLLFFMGFILAFNYDSLGVWGYITMGILFLLLLPLLRATIDRKIKIAIHKEGLWTAKWGFTIPWQDVVVSCIREDTSGRNPSFYLRIHFYDPYEDDFKMAEYNLSGLEINAKEIACLVHQFRTDFGKTDPACTTISFSQQAAG